MVGNMQLTLKVACKRCYALTTVNTGFNIELKRRFDNRIMKRSDDGGYSIRCENTPSNAEPIANL